MSRKEKKINYEICNTNFAQKSTLNTHVLTVHEGKKQFKCAICDATFGKKSTLYNHVETAHGDFKMINHTVFSQ